MGSYSGEDRRKSDRRNSNPPSDRRNDVKKAFNRHSKSASNQGGASVGGGT